MKLMAARYENNTRYEDAAKVYNLLGMSEKASEMDAKPKPNQTEKENWDEDLTVFMGALEEVRNKFKDYSFMTEEERQEIINNCKKEAEAELEKLKA